MVARNGVALMPLGPVTSLWSCRREHAAQIRAVRHAADRAPNVAAECRHTMRHQPRHVGTWGRCTSGGSDATLHLAADGRIAVHVNLLGR